jgi:hypothetical protein
MKQKDLEYVQTVVECEGFDYAFNSYSSFSEIKDVEFHRLREAFLAARQELADFVGLDD